MDTKFWPDMIEKKKLGDLGDLNFEADNEFLYFFYKTPFQVLKIIQIESMFSIIENNI